MARGGSVTELNNVAAARSESDSSRHEATKSTFEDGLGNGGVFGGNETVRFRTVSWQHATVFMIKMTLGLGVLSIPEAFYQLGAVGGAIILVFWAALMAYLGGVIGDFVIRHPSTHTISDACYIAVSPMLGEANALIVREIVEFLNIMTFTLSSGALILSLTIALNAISHHATCTVVFSVVSYLWIAGWASIRKIEKLSWFAWLGLICIISALLIVIIAVTIPARPAAAPQSGPFDLGFNVAPPPGTTFVAAWSAALAIFFSFSNICGFVPVISEMKQPSHYYRAVYSCMGLVFAICLPLSLTMYAYTGKWVASPALGSAGGTIKVIAYAVAIPGLTASGAILTHVAAKTLFVRILRGTQHIANNTKTHWATWIACTFGVGAMGFVLAEAIPFFNQLVSLIGALGFGPLSICAPTLLWVSLHKDDERSWRKVVMMILHAFIFLLGLFATVGGTYANVVQIIDNYKTGDISRPFTCADNSS